MIHASELGPILAEAIIERANGEGVILKSQPTHKQQVRYPFRGYPLIHVNRFQLAPQNPSSCSLP